ncbi:MAG: ABC transporter ATP-binding protein [Polyangiaceae bacterium]|nr:ABC transporter ATP-binding protein [Polyangiaceae bacterium]
MASLRPPPREYFTGTLPDPASKRTLDVSNVSVRFHEKVVLKNVSFFVPVGEFLCLCGPNGAGKSTLLKSILGLHRPSSGAITIAGLPLREGRKKIGYVPQRKSFDRDFPATALEVVVANLRGGWPFRIREDERELAKKALVRTGAEKLIDSQMRDLSGGETQRVFLARALITQPELIILDEPTAGVDVGGRAAIVDLLSDISRSDTIAAILVTHNIQAIARCAERVLYLDRTVRAWGLWDELATDQNLAAIHVGDHKAGDHRGHALDGD